jgi:hypothetical protein
MTANRKPAEPFSIRKFKGQKAEKTCMELIALMGGTAQSIGAVPSAERPTPRFTCPSATDERGFTYAVSPDIVFTLPDQPRGMASLAQVKMKKLQTEASKGGLFVYLDEPELHRMNTATLFYDVFFIIQIPELAEVDGFSQWMWVNVDDLQEGCTTLIKRQVAGKPTFLLPLTLFQPLSELKKRPLHEPANTNAPPTSDSA